MLIGDFVGTNGFRGANIGYFQRSRSEIKRARFPQNLITAVALKAIGINPDDFRIKRITLLNGYPSFKPDI